MTDGIGIATHDFANAVRSALETLETRLKEIGTGLEPLFDRRDRYAPDPTNQAGDQAAAAIFQAESAFSQACLQVLAARADGVDATIRARRAGDAVLRFAACSFRGLVAHRHSSHPRVRTLLDIANQVGAVTGGRSGRLAASPAAPLAPRMSPLG